MRIIVFLTAIIIASTATSNWVTSITKKATDEAGSFFDDSAKATNKLNDLDSLAEKRQVTTEEIAKYLDSITGTPDELKLFLRTNNKKKITNENLFSQSQFAFKNKTTTDNGFREWLTVEIAAQIGKAGLFVKRAQDEVNEKVTEEQLLILDEKDEVRLEYLIPLIHQEIALIDDPEEYARQLNDFFNLLLAADRPDLIDTYSSFDLKKVSKSRELNHIAIGGKIREAWSRLGNINTHKLDIEILNQIPITLASSKVKPIKPFLCDALTTSNDYSNFTPHELTRKTFMEICTDFNLSDEWIRTNSDDINRTDDLLIAIGRNMATSAMKSTFGYVKEEDLLMVREDYLQNYKRISVLISQSESQESTNYFSTLQRFILWSLADLELSFGNYRHAYDLSRLVLRMSDHETVGDAIDLLFHISLLNQRYNLAVDLLSVQRSLANRKSTYWQPGSSKISLAMSLVAIRNITKTSF